MLTYARIKPAVNEIELNPINVQNILVQYMKDNNIVPIAYCPLAKGSDTSRAPNVLEYPEVKNLAGKYGRTGS